MHVLVVDDQAFWREALTETLVAGGYRVSCAADGEEAWRTLQRQPDVDLLVTDWMMPKLSGPELCRRVRSAARDRYLPILLLTALSEQRNLVSGLDAGADAFVRKPFEAPELLAQLRVAERILALEARLAERIEELDEVRRRRERDLLHAAEVQRSFMPGAPPQLPGLSCAWHHAMCDQVGGDLFNVLRLSEYHVGLYVLDVSGHGMPAALHSVSLGHVLHAQPQQGGILKRISDDKRRWSLAAPSEVAAELNHRFPWMERSGHYFTFLYGVLEVPTRRLRYVRAGHPPPIVARPGEIRCDAPGGGIPIGIAPDFEYQDEEIELAPGDRLLLLTDGVFETRDRDGEEFGLEQTRELLDRAAADRIESVVDRLRLALDDFRKETPPHDDVTIVGVGID